MCASSYSHVRSPFSIDLNRWPCAVLVWAAFSLVLTGLCGCPADQPNEGDTEGESAGPAIEFTFVPERGSDQNLRGRVEGVAYSDFKVVVYINVIEAGGWWIKPAELTPLTDICADLTWSADITTGGYDNKALKIAAFLYPSQVSPPLLLGSPHLPAELFENAAAYTCVIRARKLMFSGYEWWVKASALPVSPGDNFFSDDPRDVWVDESGYLHMTISERKGKCYSTEIVSTESFGYGDYVFRAASPFNNLDDNTVVGLFTWSDNPEFSNREIDIEFSRWGLEVNLNAQFVVQPFDTEGNIERFDVDRGDAMSTHRFSWLEDSISFRSVYGIETNTSQPKDVIHTWDYFGPDIPVQGDENVRMNFWLLPDAVLTENQRIEIVISAFDYSVLVAG